MLHSLLTFNQWRLFIIRTKGLLFFCFLGTAALSQTTDSVQVPVMPRLFTKYQLPVASDKVVPLYATPLPNAYTKRAVQVRIPSLPPTPEPPKLQLVTLLLDYYLFNKEETKNNLFAFPYKKP